MSKYKVGDSVRVRKDLKVGQCYDGGCKFVAEMADKRGCSGVIKEVRPNSIDGGYCDIFEDRYYVDFDGKYEINFFNYSNSMLEPFDDSKASTKRPKVEIYDIENHNCPYIDLEMVGVKQLLILEPHVVIIDENTLEIFVATCHPEDEFNVHQGIDVALCKRAEKELKDALEKNKEEIERLQNRGRVIKRQIEDVKKDLKKY